MLKKALNNSDNAEKALNCLSNNNFQQAVDWIASGEIGNSSKTLWCFFMDATTYNTNVPYDSGDFGRCYKLLKAVPLWRKELHRAKVISPTWNDLIEVWDKLEKLYEKGQTERKFHDKLYNELRKIIMKHCPF